MFGAWSYLSYLWDLGFGGAKRWGCFQRGQFLSIIENGKGKNAS